MTHFTIKCVIFLSISFLFELQSTVNQHLSLSNNTAKLFYCTWTWAKWNGKFYRLVTETVWPGKSIDRSIWYALVKKRIMKPFSQNSHILMHTKNIWFVLHCCIDNTCNYNNESRHLDIATIVCAWGIKNNY